MHACSIIVVNSLPPGNCKLLNLKAERMMMNSSEEHSGKEGIHNVMQFYDISPDSPCILGN